MHEMSKRNVPDSQKLVILKDRAEHLKTLVYLRTVSLDEWLRVFEYAVPYRGCARQCPPGRVR